MIWNPGTPMRMILPALAASVWLACVAPSPATAQQIVARVNGDPITAVDLAQRMRRQQILDEFVIPPARKPETVDDRLIGLDGRGRRRRGVVPDIVR